MRSSPYRSYALRNGAEHRRSVLAVVVLEGVLVDVALEIISANGVVDPAQTMNIDSDWEAGSPVRYLYGDGRVDVQGEVLEVDRPNRLVYSWHALYNPQAAEETPSRVTWQIERAGGATKLTMVHDSFPQGSVVYPEISEGWAGIISSMKSLLETSEPLAYAS